MSQYYSLLPTRRLGKILCSKFFSSAPRSRTPSSLQDSLSSHGSRRPTLWTHCLLILVTVPCFYYAYSCYVIGHYSPVQIQLHSGEMVKATTEAVNAVNDGDAARNFPLTLVPLPTLNVKDIINEGGKMNEKGFLPLVKSPYIEVTVAHFAGEIYDVKNATLISSTTLNPIKNAMTCTISRPVKNEVEINKTEFSLEWVDGLYPQVLTGGLYIPLCLARHKVAILVPYTWHRKSNLASFLLNIHPFLMRQNLEYRIIVLEQDVTYSRFNKGRLYNAGFLESRKLGAWRCMVFHDVDLLPLDRRVLYTCPDYPRHMCAAVEHVKNEKTFKTLFGGVSALTPQQFEKANGYSNMYWAWGGEDHDIFWRLKKVGFPVVRYNKSIARYTMLPHLPTPRNPSRYKLLQKARERQSLEGLNTVEYEVVSITKYHLYTKILINVNPNREGMKRN